MKHTELNIRNYGSYAVTILLLGIVTVGFGSVDLIMVAPLGVVQLAAVGQAEVIVMGIFAFFIGLVDVYGSRLAMAEGKQATKRRLPVLLVAALGVLVLFQLAGLLLVIGMEEFLHLVRQDPELIPHVSDYVGVRIFGLAFTVLFLIAIESLKICGMKNFSVVTLVLGLAANGALNWAFLYSRLASHFSSPASAVATATVVAHIIMAGCAGWVFWRRLRQRREPLSRPSKVEVRKEFVSMARTSSGVGGRHVNDYMGAVIPLLFVGTMGVEVLAAAVVAVKVFTLFCRVPQACTSGSFVFYGYHLGRGGSNLSSLSRLLLIYAAVPTAIATIATVLLSPWLVSIFADGSLDERLAQLLLFAILLRVPIYLLSAHYGELLTVHQRGGLLTFASTLTTYVVSIPLVGLGVFVLESVLFAYACGVVGTTLLAVTFRRALRTRHWREEHGTPVSRGEVLSG